MRKNNYAFILIAFVLFIFCTLATSVAAIEVVVDEIPSCIVDSSYIDKAYSNVPPNDPHVQNTASKIQLSNIQNYQHVTYIGYVLPLNAIPDGMVEGENDFSYTLYGETHPCRVYYTHNRDYLGVITKTQCIIYFDDWDIKDNVGTGYVSFPSPIAKICAVDPAYFECVPKNGRLMADGISRAAVCDVTVTAYLEWQNHLTVSADAGSYYISLTRNIGGTSYPSTINILNNNYEIFSNAHASNVTLVYRKSEIDAIKLFSDFYDHKWSLGTTPGPSKFSLSLSTDSTTAGETIQGTVDTTGITYDSLHYFIDGREYITTDNPYSFIATGKVGKEYMVYVDAYYQGSFTGDSTNYVMYEITEGVKLENQYSLSLDKDVYTQGETAIGILDDSSATDIADEIIWKVIPMQDNDGDMSTVSGFKVDYEKNGAGWLKDGEGNYTYEEVKAFSHLLDGYGNIQIEADVYNATKGLVALPYESAYVNPASWYRNAYVYLYADGGLYQGETHITTKYILRDESTTYITYTGYKQITVVRGGDYTIHIDLDDNSKYNDVDMVYSNQLADEKIRVYLEENYTRTEYAKLTARIVDTSGIPIYGATVKIAGSTYTSGDEGQVIYYGLDNATVSILVSKEGYQTVEATTTLSSASNSIKIILPLISEVTGTVTPTPTTTGDSDSGLDTNSPFYNFYRIFMAYGLSEEMAGIAIAMSICGVLFLLGVKFAESTSGGLAGAVVGIIFCSIAGLIPMWVIMTIILISAAILATKMYGEGK